tara:strand:- start:11 stop:1033 length:1023 start_codon:yes stop_codon:yes gene_type:complete
MSPGQYFYKKNRENNINDLPISPRPPYLGFFPQIQFHNQTSSYVFHEMFHHGNFKPFLKALESFFTETDSHVYIPIFESSIYAYISKFFECDRSTLTCDKRYFNILHAFLFSILTMLCITIFFTLFSDVTAIFSFVNNTYIKLMIGFYMYLYLIYNYKIGCAPALPTCLVADFQSLVTQDFSECTCVTFSFLDDYNCTKPECYTCPSENAISSEISYKTCDDQGLGIFWAPMFLLKWKADYVLDWIHTNQYANIVMENKNVNDFITDYLKGKPIQNTDIDCFYLNIFNVLNAIILVLFVLYVLFVIIIPFIIILFIQFIKFVIIYSMTVAELIAVVIMKS